MGKGQRLPMRLDEMEGPVFLGYSFLCNNMEVCSQQTECVPALSYTEVPCWPHREHRQQLWCA